MDAPAPNPRRWAILAVLCLGLLITGIDGTIVNVALPTLVRDIHASNSQLQWVVDAYTILFASTLLIAGNTGDRLGRKRCFVVGLVVFIGGSLGCALVHTPGTLIILRAVEGLGAAFIMPATLSILTNVFTDNAERARAISLWAGVSGLGVAIGPLAGGYLLGHFWWGSIFLVNVPVVAVALIGALILVPESLDPDAPPLDLVGTLLSTVGLVALLYAIIEGPTRGWSSPLILGMAVAAIVLLVGFVLWERRTDHPILDVTFFANPRFTAASISVTLVFFAMFGSLFFVSQYLQFVLRYTALQSGIRLLPVAGILMVAAPLSARLVARFGTKRVVAAGLVLVAASLLLFSRASDSSGYPLVAGVLVVIGAGMGLAMAPATDSIMGSLPPQKAGVGSAMNDTTREIGGALGVAIMGSITSAVYSSRIEHSSGFASLAKASPAAAAAVKSSVGAASIVAAKLPASAAKQVTRAADDAFIHAIDRTVIVGAIVALGGALVAYLFLPAFARDGEEVEELIEGAARLTTPERQSLARATLGLLAEAGMASLTYSGVSARSGVGTATLQHYWTSRIDGVVDAINEVFSAHPVPDTGDLRQDLLTYGRELGVVLADDRARRVLGALIAEGARDPVLAEALHDRAVAPRRAQLVHRLAEEADRLRVPLDTAPEQFIGPLYHRALIVGGEVDDHLLDAVVSALVN
jgi:EmrB/QacA subfamily drug resistance transporter